MATWRVATLHSLCVGVERFDPAPIDVERPGSILEDVGCNGADEGLAGKDPELDSGLERSAPAGPSLGGGCVRFCQKPGDLLGFPIQSY